MELKKLYSKIKPIIENRLSEFKTNFENGDGKYVFGELAFCLLTPQSKAKSCFKAISPLIENGMLFTASSDEIESRLFGVRFKVKKAKYIVEARNLLSENGQYKIKDIVKSYNNIFELRDWLVKSIKGYGYKEASHFLRNIGMGNKISILDRHILKNLKLENVIEEVPKSITKKQYFGIETKMTEFSKKIKIPMDHLDLLLWYKEAGEVFK